MGKTPNGPKQRWNEANYTQVNVALPPQVAAAFKEKCLDAGVSMRSEIIRLVGESAPIKPPPEQLDEKRKRRKAVKSIILRLEAIMEAERQYAERIPENLKNGEAYEVAEETVSALENAIGYLNEAY